MSKADVGQYVVFIILAIGMFVAAMLILFWHYIDMQGREVTREACLMKLQNYCYRWVTEKKQPGNWNEIYPEKGCENFNISEPKQDYCENMFGVKIS